MESAASDSLFAELADVLLRISREIDPNGARAIDIPPLTGTEALVMRWVDRNPGSTPSSVADAIALQRSNLSVALGSLVKKGMVERRPDPEDARTVQLFSTELAKRSVEKLHTHWAGMLRQALGADEGDLVRTISVLTRIDDGLRAAPR
ncbi:DNA-binding transcriptional regulator, MarR family [Curtobacterium sp. UNCCL20]|uniref:MarR family winged helix-turn-helix transcriptional regulator n=1 Tax=Curtobacterium sp. UNCCL20 TaxID=1502773 RepID=UPI0008802C8D|nr:MarR family winged helix-turn-helix transcriptional regulator [Curtobacterium sp. UNCCL20]SDQ21173.1 DNA-binding transcriptional regulator, MarR family [Curtobacterium sp. UNCCL20]